MDVTPVLQIVRMVASEFSDIDDATVGQWIELTAPLISKKRFGSLYHQALALLTAHRMKMANVDVTEGDSEGADDMSVGNLMRVASYSEGQTSVSFNSNTAQFTGKDAEYGLTEYGIQYLSLRLTCGPSIVSGGEW